jgi:hypothetical protein
MLGMAARDRMILQLAEAPRERDMLGARDLLIAQKEHAMREQRAADSGEERVVVNGIGEIDAGQFRAECASELLDMHVVSSDDEHGRTRGLARFEIAVRVLRIGERVLLGRIGDVIGERRTRQI